MNWFLCRNCSTLVVIGSDLKSWLKVTVIWGSSLCLQTSACFLFRISFSSLAIAFTSFCASIQGESTTCMCFNNKQCLCPRRGFLWKAYWDWKYLFFLPSCTFFYLSSSWCDTFLHPPLQPLRKLAYAHKHIAMKWSFFRYATTLHI